MNNLLHAQIEVSNNLTVARQVIHSAFSALRFAEEEGAIDGWDVRIVSPLAQFKNATSSFSKQVREMVPDEFRDKVKFSFIDSNAELSGQQFLHGFFLFVGSHSLVAKQAVGLMAKTLENFGFSAVDARRLPIANVKDFGAQTGQTAWVDLSCSLWRSAALSHLPGFSNSKIASLIQSFEYSWKALNSGHSLGHCSEAVYFDSSVHFPRDFENSQDLFNSEVGNFSIFFEENGISIEQVRRILQDRLRGRNKNNVNFQDKLVSVLNEVGNHFA